MPITNCLECGSAYEAGSEEQANEPGRTCRRCDRVTELERQRAALVEACKAALPEAESGDAGDDADRAAWRAERKAVSKSYDRQYGKQPD